MQSSSRSFRVGLLLLFVLGLAACGSDDSDSQPVAQAASPSQEASASSPASEQPKPSFDRSLLLGDWDTSIDDPENGMRLDIKVKYGQDDFRIEGVVSLTDPNESTDDGLKEFSVSGTWTLEGDILTETAKESTFPLWRVGVSSPATVKTLDDSTFVFERSGAVMTFTRI